jgi:uncharacterized 2Fe-2S/4Fe-4S cluster protein (DUF4445 family)
MIHHGMRAEAGAIESVYIGRRGNVLAKTIGGGPARGICGTGLIDAAAELLRVGLIAPSGYFKSPDEFSSDSPELRERVISENGQRAFVLAAGKETADGGPILFTAGDVRQLQLVKGSICAAIKIICRQMEVGFDEIEEVLIAGAFGNYLRKASVLAIGLLPDMDPERIHFIGNAAGAGARLALVDKVARERAERISREAMYVDLAQHPDYMEVFSNEMRFPEMEK